MIPDVSVKGSEAIRAFLRIRPAPDLSEATRAAPYLEVQDEKTVIMRPPVVSLS
jgi:kinesin family protein 20